MAVDQNLLNQSLSTAALLGDSTLVASLIAEGADPAADGSMALRFSSMNGHCECVELLLPLSGAGSCSMALIMASLCGRAECVKLVLAISKQVLALNDALESAANRGHTGCMLILLPLIPAFSTGALLSAARSGRAAAVSTLLGANLDYAAHSSCISEARDCAVDNGHVECAQILTSVIERFHLDSTTEPAIGAMKPLPRL